MAEDELKILYELLLDYVERYGLTDKAREAFLFELRQFDISEKRGSWCQKPSSKP